MQHTVYHSDQPPFTWIDVTAPSPAELQELAARYNLPATAVEDCLDPEHLPKYERFHDSIFLILRVFDPVAPGSAGTVQELTRKIALFLRAEVALTVHRIDLPAIAAETRSVCVRRCSRRRRRAPGGVAPARSRQRRWHVF